MFSLGKFLENISLKGSDYIITVSNLFRKRNIQNGLLRARLRLYITG